MSDADELQAAPVRATEPPALPAPVAFVARSRPGALFDTAMGAGLGAPSPTDLIGYLGRRPADDRQAAIEDLNGRVGNRRVARMIMGAAAPARMVQRSEGEEGGRPAPAPHPGPLTQDRVEDQGGRHIRISEYGTDPNERLKPGQKPTLNELYWVDFEVDANGKMKASARTEDPTGKYRSPTLKFKDEFNRAIEHFKTKGKTETREFHGDWSWMSPKEMSKNLRKYVEALDAGATPRDAARQTPSGRIADAAGFTEIEVLSDKPEKVEDIGDGKSYRRVRARFARPGAGGKPGGGSVKTPPPPAHGGGGSTTKTSTRVGAAGALVVLGASVGLNYLIGSGNEDRIRDEYKRLEPIMQKEQQDEPTLGFLLLFRYEGGGAGLEGSTATPRFTRLGWQRGYTEAETKARWAQTTALSPNAKYEFGWVPPLTPPSPLLMATPFEKVALAKWADIGKVEFQRLQFKEWGGFDTKGTDGPHDGRKWRGVFEAMRFVVMRVPPKITHLDINRRPVTKEVESKEVRVQGGTVPALMADGTPAVTVWPGDEPTVEFFRKLSRRIDDKEGKLNNIVNLDLVRWVPPEQVQLVKGHDAEPPPPRTDKAR